MGPVTLTFAYYKTPADYGKPFVSKLSIQKVWCVRLHVAPESTRLRRELTRLQKESTQLQKESTLLQKESTRLRKESTRL